MSDDRTLGGHRSEGFAQVMTRYASDVVPCLPFRVEVVSESLGQTIRIPGCTEGRCKVAVKLLGNGSKEVPRDRLKRGAAAAAAYCSGSCSTW